MLYRYHETGLTPEEELPIVLVCLGVPFLLILTVYLLFRRRLKQFYAAHEYRASGEVLKSRQIYATPDTACWELTVTFQNGSGEEETVQLTTWDPALAEAKFVELALVPSELLIRPDPFDRSATPDILQPRYWAKHVRLWEERNVTSLQRIKRKLLGRNLLIALIIVAALFGMMILAYIAGNS